MRPSQYCHITEASPLTFEEIIDVLFLIKLVVIEQSECNVILVLVQVENNCCLHKNS